MRLNIQTGCALSFSLALLIMATVFAVAIGVTPAGVLALLTT